MYKRLVLNRYLMQFLLEENGYKITSTQTDKGMNL